MEDISIVEEKLDKIKNVVLNHVSAKYIFLFGSYAYGYPSKESDIDIYVVVPDEVNSIASLYADIIGDLFENHLETNIDMTLKHESHFNYRKTRSRFENTILNQGKVLYAST